MKCCSQRGEDRPSKSTNGLGGGEHMKQMIKKVSSWSALLLAGPSLFLLGNGFASRIDEMLESQLVMMAEGLTETIIPLSEEEIAGYQESADEFTGAC